jgi:ABC-type phosphate/phosphonate transport system substrate-binding protein
MRHFIFRAVALCTAIAALVFQTWPALPLAAGEGDTASRLRIGMASSFFADVPKENVGSGRKIFAALMKQQTGLDNDLAEPMAAAGLAKMLAEDRLDLVILQGVEFAWARQKHADLRPLLIVVNQRLYRQAHLLVRRDSTAQSWLDLKGKEVAMPAHSREHCQLFLERHCGGCGLEHNHLFIQLIKPSTVEDALDDLVDGQVQGAVVDDVGMKSYERRKPGRFAKLKDLEKSELFPDSVVAYRAGSVGDAILRRCRDGLLKADKQIQGQLLLMLWRVTAFAAVPPDFEQKLTQISKDYPPAVEPTARKNDKSPLAKDK